MRIPSLPMSVKYAIALALLVRVAGLIWIYVSGHGGTTLYGDGLGYIELARNLVDGHGFALWREGRWITETFRTPGLPVLLIPFTLFSWGIFLYQIIMAVVAGVGLPFLGWASGRRLFSEKVGVIVAWLFALEPLTVVFSWLPLTEVPFILAGLAALIFAFDAYAQSSKKLAILSGALSAIAIYFRPGNLLLLLIAYMSVGVYYAYKRRAVWRLVALSMAVFLLLLSPWMGRVYARTGSFALSGTGWRNVFTDYLSSIRAVEHKTMFWNEKTILKDHVAAELGLSRFEINNPANSSILRDYALKEIIQHPVTVIKLQGMIWISYFTNDGYISALMRFGFIPNIAGRSSATYVVLTDGWKGVGTILFEMRRQWFIPVVGRMVTVLIFIAMFIGAFKWRKNPSARWCVLLIVWSAVAASALGLGVEGRLRLSISPLIFFLAAAALDRKTYDC